MENEVSRVDSSWPIFSENSEWMVENVKGLDQSVKKMLLLIEHDGEVPMENDDSNNEAMKPELIACVKEISHRHHLLVDRYNKLTGDLRNFEKTSFGSPFLTPEKKFGMQNVEGQVVPSELCLSSGGGISDATPNEGSESSLLSSDSDSETYDSSPEKKVKSEGVYVETEVSGEYEMLARRILDYENELKVSKEKLESAEDEIARQKKQIEDRDAIIVEISGVEAQLLSARNQIKVHEAEMEEGNMRSLMLERKIFDLEAKFESEKTRVQELKKELLDRDGEIEQLNDELQQASAEKLQFESSVSMLSESLNCHESRTNILQKQCESLEAEKVEMMKNQEAQIITWKDNIEQVKAELWDKNGMVDILNQHLDKLKQNYDMVIAEKDELSAKLHMLSGEISAGDDQIRRMEHNVDELRVENDEANKVIGELRSRINELEKNVGVQKAEIWEICEEKREAIRQLCFALDHFRRVYQEVRDVYVIKKRPAGVIR